MRIEDLNLSNLFKEFQHDKINVYLKPGGIIRKLESTPNINDTFVMAETVHDYIIQFNMTKQELKDIFNLDEIMIFMGIFINNELNRKDISKKMMMYSVKEMFYYGEIYEDENIKCDEIIRKLDTLTAFQCYVLYRMTRMFYFEYMRKELFPERDKIEQWYDEFIGYQNHMYIIVDIIPK